MNITKALSLLREDIDIEKLNSKVKDDVPQKTLDALASRMKNNKYDNVAATIIKELQRIKQQKARIESGHYDSYKKDFPEMEIESPPQKNIDYLQNNPLKVYAALNKFKRNNSEFDPQALVSGSFFAPDPNRFWLDIYSTKQKEMKKEKFGLPNARVRETKEEFLIFPKTFKQSDRFGLTDDDLYKQYQDIKALSSQMARKDDSGEVDGDKKANANHWCVAASESSHYFNNYKKEGGIFVIITKKKPDGSPDFTRRYLYYTNVGKPTDDYDPDYERKEFADKFDNHVELTVLSPEARSILKKLYPADSKRNEAKAEVSSRIRQAVYDDRENSHTAGGEEWDAFKKLLDTVNSFTDKSTAKLKNVTTADIQKFTKDLYRKTGNGDYNSLRDWFVMNGKPSSQFMYTVYTYTKGPLKATLMIPTRSIYSHRLAIRPAIDKNNKSHYIMFMSNWTDKLMKEMTDFINKGLGFQLQLVNKNEVFPDRLDFNKLKESFTPFENRYKGGSEKYLKSNSKLDNEYQKRRREYAKYIVPLGYNLELKREMGEYVITTGTREIAKLMDKDMPKKVMAYLKKHDEEEKDPIPF